jgi:hypothetical protein
MRDETLEAAVAAALAADDEEVRLPHVRALQAAWSPALRDDMLRRLRAPSAAERELAADVLGQGWRERKEDVEVCAGALVERLEAREREPLVLFSVGVALGHLGVPRGLGALLRLARHGHALARLGAVRGLAVQDDALATEALARLADDADADVREWATYALVDGPGARPDAPGPVEAVLRRRVDEAERPGTRGAALLGLARRGAPGVGALLERELQRGGAVSSDVFEAVEVLPDARLFPVLRALEPDWGDRLAFRRALQACRPQ